MGESRFGSLAVASAILWVLGSCLSACGQKGPLTLPAAASAGAAPTGAAVAAPRAPAAAASAAGTR